MAAPAFDPLIDFDGQWNTRLAERYLPLPELPGATYECVEGKLFVTPSEAFSNTYGEARLVRILGPAVDAAGYFVTTTVNLTLNPGTWLQPDVTVLHTLPADEHEDRWVPVTSCLMAVEFVSPSSRRTDRIDKPALYAAAGVPYLMRVEIVRKLRHASVALMKLTGGEYRDIAGALTGQRMVTDEPFPIDFPVEDLLY